MKHIILVFGLIGMVWTAQADGQTTPIVSSGASLPTQCPIGSLYIQTGVSASVALNWCAAINTWTAAVAGTTLTIASGTSALGTSAIASGACATTVTTSATGTATTDNIMADFNFSPLAVTGYIASSSGMLTIIKWPTANNVNFAVCNNTSASITPGAITLNWRVVR